MVERTVASIRQFIMQKVKNFFGKPEIDIDKSCKLLYNKKKRCCMTML